MNPWKVFFFCLFSTSLIADSIKFSDGKILEDVKIIVKKEVVEIRYKDGKSEIRNKNEFKNSKIKIIPVAWFNNNTSENSVSLHEGRQARINQQMYILEQQREANFALSQKVVEERKTMKIDDVIAENQDLKKRISELETIVEELTAKLNQVNQN